MVWILPKLSNYQQVALATPDWRLRRTVIFKENARPNLKTVQGLGRNYSWKERFGKEHCVHGNC